MKSPKKNSEKVTELKKQITLVSCEVESVRDSLRGAILAIEIERSAMAKAKVDNDFEADLQAILGLGVLLGDLQKRRVRLMELSSRLPSPNKVPTVMGTVVMTLGKKIFETTSHIKNIQAEIYRLARLNLRVASHKVNFAEKSMPKRSTLSYSN